MTTYGFSTSQINEAQWASMNAPVVPEHVESGFVASPGAATREIDLTAGTALVAGTWTSLAADTVTLPANSSGNPRIDTVVLKIDWSANTGTLTYVQGTAAASPVAPSLTRTAGTTWECPLADVYVADGATSFIAGNITDRRPHVVPVYSQESSVSRPLASDRALLVESDTGSLYQSDGSAWALAGGGYCSAKLSADVTVSEATTTLINTWADDENSGQFTVGSSGVTVTDAGVYLVSFDVLMVHGVDTQSWYSATLGVNVSGTTFATELRTVRDYSEGKFATNERQSTSVSGTTIASLSAGDVVGVTVYGDKSGNTASWTVPYPSTTVDTNLQTPNVGLNLVRLA